MKKLTFRFHTAWLAILALTLLAAPAFGQVPQDMTFTGRLVDGAGNPIVGPVSLRLHIFDADIGGTPLYYEWHSNTDLDVTGGFSVQLGLGFPSFGSLDATLFSDVNRWLEVAVNGEVLSPRQVIASVPWALVSEQANKIVRNPNAPRFEDCGDGTVADHQTGLQWEKKTGTVGGGEDLSDPHNVDNTYQWSLGTPWDPDGGAFTDFLARLNGDPTVVAATSGEAEGDPAADPTVCFAHHCDWHLPAIGEIRTILIGPEAAPAQPDTCSSAPCIDREFAAVGGPTASSNYWSASYYAGNPLLAWLANFGSGYASFFTTTYLNFVRAVRAGSCN